jgi:hypothetical protein
MGTAVIADVSIGGNAKYVYTNTDISSGEIATTANTGNTEINLAIDGKNGDTRAHLELEFSQGANTVADSGATVDTNMDIEDMWVSTKIGSINLKMGNWDGSKSANTGEILDNGRSGNKVSVTTTVQGVKLGYWNTPGVGTSDGFTIAGTVAGVNIGIKESPNAYTDINLSGELAGVTYRWDHFDSDTSNGDADFATASYTVNDVTVSGVHASANRGNVFTETDGVFGTDMDLAEGDVQEASAIKIASTVAGNAISLQAGVRTEATGEDNDFTKVVVSRALASGVKAIATFIATDDVNAATDRNIFKAELNVSF